MPSIEISPNVYWVGAIDWDLRFCGSYNTPRGTTYNAYLILDKKIALIDSVKNGFEDEMLSRIREITDPEKIDYVISQHAERDHAGGISELMKIAKRARVIATPQGKKALFENYGTDWGADVVKTKDELNLGKKTLMFIQAELLHWPDSMFTYLKEDKILFPNDAFGQHIATHKRFFDEVGPAAMEEATKYFAVIVSVYSNLVQKKIKEIEDMGIGIKTIAPAHGVIWRQPEIIIEAYKRWSSGEADRKITIVFDTMWQSTDIMAREIARGISNEDVEVRLYNLRTSEWSMIIKDIIESRLVAIGSPTLNMGMYPSVGGFLTFLKGIRPPNKKAVAFGSYGWNKGAVRDINVRLKEMDFEVLESLELQYVPTREDLATCFEFGKKLAKVI
jgi:flavorubredoxin